MLSPAAYGSRPCGPPRSPRLEGEQRPLRSDPLRSDPLRSDPLGSDPICVVALLLHPSLGEAVLGVLAAAGMAATLVGGTAPGETTRFRRAPRPVRVEAARVWVFIEKLGQAHKAAKRGPALRRRGAAEWF